MPRGDRSGDSDVLAKRAATYAKKKAEAAKVQAVRLLRRCVPDAGDAGACVAWLATRGIELDAPNLRPRDRRRWLLRAKREMT